MNAKTIVAAVLIVAAGAAVPPVNAQTVIKRQVQMDGFFMLPELGAAIIQQKDTLRVDLVPPTERIPKEYASVDLKVGDLILMMNGKRVSEAKDFEARYKALKVGDEIQLGIKRDGSLRIVKFAKGDESKLPKRQMMIKTGPGGDDHDIKISGGKAGKSIEGEHLEVLSSAGLIISLKDKRVTVVTVLPGAADKLAGGEAIEGDVVTQINGKAVSSTEGLMEIVNGLADGAKVELTLERAGKSVTVSFTKTADNGDVIIRKQ